MEENKEGVKLKMENKEGIWKIGKKMNKFTFLEE